MTQNKCTCSNPDKGFECTCDWTRKHPGNIPFTCEYCGIYEASKPRCSKCDADERVSNSGVFTLFWIDGKREVIEGASISEAFAKAGYGAGAMSALDFYSPGDNDDYEFINRKWTMK